MRLIFHGYHGLPDGAVRANVQKAEARFKIQLQDEQAHGRRLAVVGGGPSVKRRLGEIASFDDVWGINRTWQYLVANGISAAMFSIDAGPELVPMAKGAKSAVLASRTDPGVWDALDCTPTVFHAFDDGPNPVLGGSSSATCSLIAAVRLGYRSVRLFGCDSSFEDATHVDRHEERDHVMLVRCNGSDYWTAPDFYTQAKELTRLCNMCPHVLSQSGDGLLGAMVANDDHDVIRVNAALADRLGLAHAA